MKNLYKNTLEEIKLDEAAKEKICDGIINKLKEEKSEKPRVSFSLKAFRLAAACASAVLVCGTAVGTGIYFGLNGKVVDTLGIINSDVYYYYIDNSLEKNKYDLGNVEVEVSYGFKKEDIRGLYENRIKRAEIDYGKIIKFEINLVAIDVSSGFRYNCKTIQINDEFNFDIYDYDIIGYDNVYNDPIINYNYSEKIVLPSELFNTDGKAHKIYFKLFEQLEYSQGYSKETLDGFKRDDEANGIAEGEASRYKNASIDGKVWGLRYSATNVFVLGYHDGMGIHESFSYKYDNSTNSVIII